ncbi:MAG: hypothetical protein ACRC62_27215 [Microcoleus sp.]
MQPSIIAEARSKKEGGFSYAFTKGNQLLPPLHKGVKYHVRSNLSMLGSIAPQFKKPGFFLNFCIFTKLVAKISGK